MHAIRSYSSVVARGRGGRGAGGRGRPPDHRIGSPSVEEWKEIKEENGTPPEVRPNKVDAPYKDWMEYYDIQFRLVREDFIAPLRRGVAAFLQETRERIQMLNLQRSPRLCLK
ncbi:hypothetical protein GBAR_LOCUS23010 [Geodia barretti]|uniref:Uncharacterized protein n=1 Tax=Geodia barretti TaxID=519541 RepID=A0AA35X277_GEOBA|nr:hypothetical protein GBAR_LOCUS23010 [Geodia barretti]